MGKMPKPLVLLAASLVALLFVIGLFRWWQAVGVERPLARGGTLDLTGWNFAADGNVALDGEWSFYLGRLVPPESAEPPDGLFKVPANWHGKVGGTTIPPKGTATYRLAVKLDPAPERRTFALRVTYIRMASAVYVDGAEVGGSGTAKSKGDGYAPMNLPYLGYFSVAPGQRELAIVLHMANYDHWRGGISQSVYLGEASAVAALERSRQTFELAGFIAMTILGLYHIAMFLGRYKKLELYFGLFTLLLALAGASFGEKLVLQWLSFLPFEILYKLQSLFPYICPLFFALFVKEIDPRLFPSGPLKLLKGTIPILALIVLLFPFRIYNPISLGLIFIGLLAYGSFVFMLIRLYNRQKYGELDQRSLFLIICALSALIVGCADMTLFLFGATPDTNVTIICSVIFSVLVSLMLIFRSTAAFRTIEELSVRLLAVDRLKDEFLANTSHELQTPLNGVVNISRYLLEGGAGTLSGRQSHNVSVIYSLARKLSSLTQDILDIERLRQNALRIEPEPLDLEAAVTVALDVFGFLAAGKPVRFERAIPECLYVRADDNRFNQIVYNLLGNALKFTEKGVISLRADREDDRVRLIVEDTGIGIGQDRSELIFAWYGQAEPQIGREYGGAGLGLPLSRRLAELMGGTLELVWSEPGVGSSFALTLPAAGAPAGSDMSPAAFPVAPGRIPEAVGDTENGAGEETAAGAETQPTLLIVDDQPVNVQALTKVLAVDGYRTLVASNGPDALKLVRERRDIRLVLLDVVMPRMSGYEVCRKIRQSHSLTELPVIMLTAHNRPEDIAAGFEAGANDYVPKPFHAPEIRARVRTLLEMQLSVRRTVAAEMSFLQSQIKPHFLYNALNTVLHFIYEEDPRSADIVNHLSQYLRNSFDIPGTETFVRLDKELELIHAYVEIEKARFGGRLDVRFEIDEGVRHFPVLPLTIQPLVENAIRHGVTKRLRGGTVCVSVRNGGGDVLIEVADDGVGIGSARLAALAGKSETPRDNAGTGVGLNNIRRRLQRIYGIELHIESIEGQGTKVYYGLKRKGSGELDQRYSR